MREAGAMIDGLDLRAREGEWLAVMVANDAGKTTLCLLLAGLGLLCVGLGLVDCTGAATIDDAAVGDYTITWSVVAGHDTPAPETATLAEALETARGETRSARAETVESDADL